MKKRLFFILFIIYLIPTIVTAKTYQFDDIYANQSDTDEAYINIFEPGDEITFSSNYKYFLFLDDKEMTDCYGNTDGCKTTFEVDNKLLYLGFTGYNKNYIYFNTIDDNTKIHPLEKIEEGRLYKSGDYIAFPGPKYGIYYYNSNTSSNYWKLTTGPYVVKLLQYNDEDVLWKLSIVDGGAYSPVNLAMTLTEYVKPSFRLACNKNSINYGEKASCSLYVTSTQQLEELSFSLATPDLKVSNVKNANNVNSFDGAGEYNLRISNGYATAGVESLLMTFDLEGTKDENYVDDISITNINYRDNLYEGGYEDLKSDLNIHSSSSIKNPNTYGNLLFILLPLLIIGIALIINKKTKQYNNN